MVQKEYTTEEACQILGIGRKTLYNKVERKQISYKKYLNRIRFTQSDLDQFVERNTKRVQI